MAPGWGAWEPPPVGGQWRAVTSFTTRADQEHRMQAAVKPRQFREDLQQGDTADLWQRRAIIGLSLVGLGSMATTSLLQTGVLKHLPGPPLPGFDSDKVNLS